jgi:hypothetical protein
MGFSNIYGNGNRTIGVTIKNYTDLKSRKGFLINCYTTDRVGTETIKGTVLLENAFFRSDSDKNGPLSTALFGTNDIFLSLINPKEQAVTGKIYRDEELSVKLYGNAINKDAWYSITFKY